jgi:UDP-N-acetylglucosamine diphosphorylase/glucosamine-1-phosphate N-acetyltransferase
MSNTVIYGPCYIGKNSTIKPGAKIYPNTSIGEWCKVGGEVENSIFQAYSNKQHEGFLGHSFISEWVNLGADTNNSDLKNTYSNISMQLPHKLVNTNRIFLGLICGDHTKSGINSMFTTGTVSGLCGILVKEWFLPNYIKSYTWGGKTNSPIYKFEKAIETAKIVMLRRNKELCEEEIELLKLEYERVSQE